ncbi:putative cation/H+ exchanger, rossmann-like alpha/beta/alpha sandwich [Medicago truncatula]|uniref:Cation/H+ exchanger 3 n=1 Tax=Medicago truncatula TaxID=3880 RepID=G7LE34_MEDTR|nr:cation/H(+) antiporter 15 [Medicago truncatula]AET04756.1 cation/H+ exchanger 3 [Medicago truncatula]RHN43120.1 putative cation/H+ exchanger, rossmann-like alpha/beta/alpha sandwich [Medicago truncatula]
MADMNATADEMVCYSPTMITTNGIWQGDNPLDYSLPLFILQVILVVIATRIFVFILKPIRQPRVIAEILGGIVLGPSVLGRNKTFADAVFPLRSVMVIETMANVGLLYFLFLVGVGMDASALRRIGRKSITIAVAGMILPFGTGALFSIFLLKNTEKAYVGAFVLMLGVVLSVTAFPVLARILAELKLINTELGRVALSSALINDVLSWVLLAIAIAMAENERVTLASIMVVLSSAAFVAFNVFVVRPIIMWIIRKTPEGETFSDFYICLILAGVMISGFITDAIGTHSVFGAFVFGLIIPTGPLGFALIEKLEDFVSGLLLPLFFAISGLKTDVGLIDGPSTWAVIILLVILACVGKVVGTLIVALSYQMSVSDGAALGMLMNTKGLVEILVLNIGRDQKVLDEGAFATMVVITIMMTGLIVPGISIIYRPSRGMISYKRRTIQMSKKDAEFRVLVCIHTPRNVPTMINLLEASNPTKKSPICIYVVHLVELTGRTSALLIVHTSRKSDHPALNRTEAQSDHIINAFENYEQHAEHVSVQPLTAISPYSTMHEDICTLAEEKRVAFIIIPFHKQQTVDGGMESTNMAFRTVNQNVLANSPCSVGILVDRGLNSSNRLIADQMSHHIAVLFFGGPDDREALSYGWRMSEHSGISLTVMRFVPGDEITMNENISTRDNNVNRQRVLDVETEEDSEKQMDEKFLHWFTMSHVNDDSIAYIEKVVNNGEETVAAIRSMGDVFGLFIVGRGQGVISPLTAGLTDWSECPELGAIGDLLASSDFATIASVLVVQQYVGAGTEDGLGTPVLTNEDYVSHHSVTPPRGHQSVFNTERL